MSNTIKKFFRKILPPTAEAINRRLDTLQRELEEQKGIAESISAAFEEEKKRSESVLTELTEQKEISASILSRLNREQEIIESILSELNLQKEQSAFVLLELQSKKAHADSLRVALEEIRKVLDGIFRMLNTEHQKSENAIKQLSENRQSIVDIHNKLEMDNRNSEEILWAQIFNNIISQSPWLHNKSFCPGRAGVGYPYLYILYRVLNETRPLRILDLGLGETSKMIAQYANFNEQCEHYIVEHDQQWISFFKRNYQLSERSRIVSLNLTERPFLNDEKVLAYEKFVETFSDIKFDLLSVDGPYGHSAKTYARIDTLGLIPGNISDSFVILIDDYEREGEQNTVKLIKAKLKENNISYYTGKYSGKKDALLICSCDNRFLKSM